MPGFIDNIKKSFKQKEIGEFIKDLSSLGTRYDLEIGKNSKAIGTIQYELHKAGKINAFSNNIDDLMIASIIDTIGERTPNLFDTQYEVKRKNLRKAATCDIIEDILEIVSDEAINYDDKGFFCNVGLLDLDLKNLDDVQRKLEDNFKKIYKAFRFDDDISAWGIFFKWLVDGMIAFEIIYDDLENPKNIIAIKDIDVVTLQPGVDKSGKSIWIQFKGMGPNERILWDSQIIFLSYSEVNFPTNISYVQRLIKPYNILNILETTRIIWSVVNASFRTKFVIPTDDKPKNLAKQSVAKLMNAYNEDLNFNYETGELNSKLVAEGKPMFPYTKQFWFTSKNGISPEVETVGGSGPDLSNIDILQYFYKKIWMLSKIPVERMDIEQGGGTPYNYSSAASLIYREVKFQNFIKRLRTQFKEILLKPLRLQMAIDLPDLKNDYVFMSSIKLTYNDNIKFAKMKEMDLKEKEMDFISNMMSILDKDGEPIVPLEFLLEEYGIFSKTQIERMRKIKNASKKNKDNSDGNPIPDEVEDLL
jgi:hypothetical protein